MTSNSYFENIKQVGNQYNYNISNSQNKIFNSVDKKHQIEINLIDNISWFNINKFDFEYYKTFILLLKDVLMHLKNNRVVYIKQYIFETDCDYFKKSTIVNTDSDKYIVTTNIDCFIDEIIGVFGINKI